MQKQNKTGEDFLRGLFQRLGAHVNVHASAPEENLLLFQLDGDIAQFKRHPELTAAFNTIINQVANRDEDHRCRCVIDVGGGYLQRQTLLETVAQDAARAVARSGRRAVLDSLTPAERRVVHTALMKNASISTRSEGNEGQRLLLIEPTNGESR